LDGACAGEKESPGTDKESLRVRYPLPGTIQGDNGEFYE
jgi:hypothetical protein